MSGTIELSNLLHSSRKLADSNRFQTTICIAVQLFIPNLDGEK